MSFPPSIAFALDFPLVAEEFHFHPHPSPSFLVSLARSRWLPSTSPPLHASPPSSDLKVRQIVSARDASLPPPSPSPGDAAVFHGHLLFTVAGLTYAPERRAGHVAWKRVALNTLART